jgi:hypothetical protein
MTKLTANDLKFIHNYLKKSEVIYDDILLELTDHIASAVEEKMLFENIDFYDAFKNYMVENKRELFKKFSVGVLASMEPIKSFGMFLLQPVSLILGVFFIVSFYFFNGSIDKATFVYDFQMYWLLFIVIFGIGHHLFFRLIKKKRFFIVEQSWIVLVVVQNMLNFFASPKLSNLSKNFYGDFLILYFTIVFLFFYFSRVKKYYNNKHIWNQK